MENQKDILESILLPGFKVEDLNRQLTKEDIARMKGEIEKSKERQRACLKRKEINPELLRLVVNI